MGSPIIRYESGQTPQPFEAMSDSGDAKTFEGTIFPISKASGHEPVVAPYGILTGGALSPGGSNDQIAFEAFTVLAPGMTGADADGVVSVSGGNLSITRPLTAVAKVIAVTVDSTGTVVEVEGTDSADANFSETRGAAGGPPYIPDGSVSLGEVRVTDDGAAVILATEIYQVDNMHRETADYPTYELDTFTGELIFNEAVPLIHTGDIPKQVHIKGSTPIFAPLPYSNDWKPAKSSRSSSSEDTYDGPVATFSNSLGQAGWTTKVDDPTASNIEDQEDQELWVEYRHDRDKLLPKQLTQGFLNTDWTASAGGGKTSVNVTFSATTKSRTISA